jgi:hypothetical protein
VEDKAQPEAPVRGQVWDLFKKLRKHGLTNDQIGILIRKFGYDMSRERIMQDMGWTSAKMFTLRYNQALDALRKRGFR